MQGPELARLLRERAGTLAALRDFFSARGVLEVETPLLGSATVTDPAAAPLACAGRWLQTSPEYAMKRLLAAGSGPIYQVCKAFRGGEVGARHNPEFTMLEWYRPGFDLQDLIAEVAELAGALLGARPVEMLSYRELFQRHLDLDPHRASAAELEACARARIDYSGSASAGHASAGSALAGSAESRDTWLDLLLSHVIEPALSGLVFVFDFPASQAALARLKRDGDVEVAERFELYVDGLELANGYRELTDPAEQRRRFEADNAVLRARGEPPRPLDERLLAALEAGLPDCSGVALGLDRLLMVKMGVERIEAVLGLDWARS